jgi:hypothetical protein
MSSRGLLLTTICFDDAEAELRRLAEFIGLPHADVRNAAALVKKRRRHTHFTVEHLIDARVAPGVIELYRALIREASPTGRSKGKMAKSRETGSQDEADLLSGSVSRLNAFVPERIAQIEHLYEELLAQAELDYKSQVEELAASLRDKEYRPVRKLCAQRGWCAVTPPTEGCREALPVLDETDDAAGRLRLRALANCQPDCGLKGKSLCPESRALLGYGHLEKGRLRIGSGEPRIRRWLLLMIKSKL